MELLRFNYICYNSQLDNRILAYTFEDTEDIYVVNGRETYDSSVSDQLYTLIEQYGIKDWNMVNISSSDPNEESFDLSVRFSDGSGVLCSALASTFPEYENFKKRLTQIFAPYQDTIYYIESATPHLIGFAAFIATDLDINGYMMMEPADDHSLNYQFLHIEGEDVTNHIGRIDELPLAAIDALLDKYRILDSYAKEMVERTATIRFDELFDNHIFMQFSYSDSEAYILNTKIDSETVRSFIEDFLSEMKEFYYDHQDEVESYDILPEEKYDRIFSFLHEDDETNRQS